MNTANPLRKGIISNGVFTEIGDEVLDFSSYEEVYVAIESNTEDVELLPNDLTLELSNSNPERPFRCTLAWCDSYSVVIRVMAPQWGSGKSAISILMCHLPYINGGGQFQEDVEFSFHSTATNKRKTRTVLLSDTPPHKRILMRRGKYQSWKSRPDMVLGDGQPGYVSDLNRLMIGDNKTPWSNLGYIGDTGDFSVKRLSQDSNGIYTVVETYRPDGTLFSRSTLTGGTSPQYTTETIDYYNRAGSVKLETATYTLNYDSDGDLISEVPV